METFKREMGWQQFDALTNDGDDTTIFRGTDLTDCVYFVVVHDPLGDDLDVEYLAMLDTRPMGGTCDPIVTQSDNLDDALASMANLVAGEFDGAGW